MSSEPRPRPEGEVLPRVLLGAAAIWLAFLWGFAEGTLFFIVPDVLITLIALYSPTHALKAVGAAVAGALLAGALMFQLARRDPAGMQDLVIKVPAVSEKLLLEAASDLTNGGLPGMLRGSVTGTPYKLYAVEAPAVFSLPRFLLMSFIARLSRFALNWLLFSAAAIALQDRIRARPHRALAAHLAIWAGIYLYYWLVVWN